MLTIPRWGLWLMFASSCVGAFLLGHQLGLV
jgi:UPF0716 family protein affecting phage T7 exclusion